MKTIYRYPVNDPSGINVVNLPSSSKIISAGVGFNEETGSEEISIWVYVDTEDEIFPHTILVVGTGADLDNLSNFNINIIGTVQKSNTYAFHVMEITENNF